MGRDVAVGKSEITASGGKIVEGIGNGPGNTLTFRGINARQSGSYKLLVFFASEQDRSATITTNGVAAQNVAFPSTGSANAVNTQIIDVQLNAGDNLIAFSNNQALAPAIDKIEILQ